MLRPTKKGMSDFYHPLRLLMLHRIMNFAHSSSEEFDDLRQYYSGAVGRVKLVVMFVTKIVVK
jgi:hypothetical protein